MNFEFEESTHTYRVDGVVVPSVTQIIAPLYDFSGVDCNVMERASEFGKAAHRMCELYDQNNLDEESVDPALSPYLDAWAKFRRECEFEPTLIEHRFYCPAYRYAGQIDRIGAMQGKTALIDIKTSTTLSPAIGVQLAGYAIAALEENLIERKTPRYALKLNGNGTYTLKQYSDAADEYAFHASLTLHNWREKNGYKN